MDLKDIFAGNRGFGVLATADGEGRVNAAVFARPHLLGEDRIAFIMADRLTHENLGSNPRAAYLFRSDPANGGGRYKGIRLHLTRIEETDDPERIGKLQRRSYEPPEKERFLVTFRVDRIFPLIGPGEGEASQTESRNVDFL
jgi:hypothetical protein